MDRCHNASEAGRTGELVRLDFRTSKGRQEPTPHDWSRALFIPEHYEENYAYPLIVWLHGSGADEWQLVSRMEYLSVRNYLVVAPRGMRPDDTGSEGRGWGSPQNPAHFHLAEEQVFAGIEAVQDKYRVCPERVFVAGADCGGTMALQMAMRYPDRFAGVASLGGAFPDPRCTPLSQWNKVRRLPVFLATASQSFDYPPERAKEDLQLLCSAGLWSISFREYHPCSHPLLPRALGDVNRWIMEHLGASARPALQRDQESSCL